MTKNTVIPKEIRKQVRDALRAARNLMNDEGEHWTKGEYKRKMLVPTGRNDSWGQPILQPLEGAFQWCAVGGIQEVAKIEDIRAHSMIALVERGGLPQSYLKAYHRDVRNQLSELVREWEWELKRFGSSGSGPKPTELSLESRAQCAHDVITAWNDNDRRKWPEVSAAFVKAARAIR